MSPVSRSPVREVLSPETGRVIRGGLRTGRGRGVEWSEGEPANSSDVVEIAPVDAVPTQLLTAVGRAPWRPTRRFAVKVLLVTAWMVTIPGFLMNAQQSADRVCGPSPTQVPVSASQAALTLEASDLASSSSHPVAQVAAAAAVGIYDGVAALIRFPDSNPIAKRVLDVSGDTAWDGLVFAVPDPAKRRLGAVMASRCPAKDTTHTATTI